MIDFVGRTRSPLDDMQQWNQYFGQDTARAQQDWQDQNIRNRYNEATRYNREGAISDAQFQAQNQDPGGVNDIPGQFAGLTHEAGDPIHVASAASAGVTPQGPDSVAPGQPGGPAAGYDGLPMVTVDNGSMQNHTRLVPNPRIDNQRRGNAYNVAARNEAYGNYVRAVNDFNTGRDPDGARLNVARRIAVSTGTIAGGANTAQAQTAGTRNAPIARVNQDGSYTVDQQGVPSATIAIPPASPGDASAAGVDLGAPANLVDNPVLNPDTHVGGLEPPTDYQGTNDTTRGLVPTREMRMLETQIQDNFRRADIAARHGDRAGAQTAFAQGLVGQAAYLTQSRIVLFRAASAGSLGAMETLIGEFSGYPEGTVRLHATDERRTRFVRQVQRRVRNANGTFTTTWVTADETPHTRNEILDGLQNLIDVEGAQARSEAYNEEIRARISAGAQITVASIHYREQLVQSLTQAQIATLDSRTKLALQRGDGQLLVNSQDGSAYLRYTIQDANGNNVPVTDVIRRQNVPTPDTEGHRTTQMDVRSRATGTVNTAPGANQ